MYVIVYITFLSALWRSTLSSSLQESAHLKPSASVGQSSSTPTTRANLDPLEFLMDDTVLQRVLSVPTVASPDLRCPRWNSLPWVPLHEDDNHQGSYIPYISAGSGFVIWCHTDLPLRPPEYPDIVDLEGLQMGPSLSLAQCIRFCAEYNNFYNEFICTAVTLTANAKCYLKTNKDYTPVATQVALRSVWAAGYISAVLIPPNYEGDHTFTPPWQGRALTQIGTGTV